MTSSIDRDLVRRLRAPAYGFLAVTVLLQLFDFVSGQLPMRPTAAVWRFAALSSASHIIENLLLLLLLAYAVSLFASDRRTMLVVGIVALSFALILVGGAVSYASDSVVIRSKVPAAALAKFDLATTQALIKLCGEGIVAALVGYSAIRAMAAARRSAARQVHASETPPLIVRASAMRAP